jgi:L-seryl-tRNA(Ser) seleniumtransferase
MQESRCNIEKTTTENPGKLLKNIPSVARLLESRPVRGLIRRYGKRLVTQLLRESLETRREEIRSGKLGPRRLQAETAPKAIAAEVERAAKSLFAPRPRAVVNATGVVVHTNLGRSLLSEEAAASVQAAARSYVDLEYDLGRGRRGSRLSQLEPLMARLFPGHSFVTVNNNAAAILLCLRALGRRKEVLISRGELVEIGGSFRVPDILAASGAKLREVGTTNRTRLGDYRSALGPRTGLMLKVHTSNFRIVGFTEETTIGDLAGLARESGVPLVVDWGSGDLTDLEPLGIRDEIPAGEVLEAGADIVTFSGDKLLGGPQAGFAVGRRQLIERLRKDPLARVCRLDRLMISALVQTLGAYVRGAEFEEIPTLRMLALSAEKIGRRAAAIKRRIGSASRKAGRQVTVIDGVSKTGGGSSPTGVRPTRLLCVTLLDGDAAPLEQALREGDPPVIGRVQEGKLLLDLRTVLPDQDELVARRLSEELVDRLG